MTMTATTMMMFQTDETSLHFAARVPDGEKCAEILLKSGADCNASQQVNHFDSTLNLDQFGNSQSLY